MAHRTYYKDVGIIHVCTFIQIINNFCFLFLCLDCTGRKRFTFIYFNLFVTLKAPQPFRDTQNSSTFSWHSKLLNLFVTLKTLQPLRDTQNSSTFSWHSKLFNLFVTLKTLQPLRDTQNSSTFSWHAKLFNLFVTLKTFQPFRDTQNSLNCSWHSKLLNLFVTLKHGLQRCCYTGIINRSTTLSWFSSNIVFRAFQFHELPNIQSW